MLGLYHSQTQLAFPDLTRAQSAVQRVFEVLDRRSKIDPAADGMPRFGPGLEMPALQSLLWDALSNHTCLPAAPLHVVIQTA